MALIKTCPVCGREFKTYPSRLKWGYSKFCSRKCDGIARRESITKNCEYCGKPFTTYPCRVAAGNGKYCSARCNYAAHRITVSKRCEYCGTEFEGSPSMMTRRKYCSQTCYQAARVAKKADEQ